MRFYQLAVFVCLLLPFQQSSAQYLDELIVEEPGIEKPSLRRVGCAGELIGESPLLVVSANLNGTPRHFVLDTCASHNVYAKRLRSSIRGDLQSGTKEGTDFEMCAAQDLRFGEYTDPHQLPSIIVDLSVFDRVEELEADGVIGIPMLVGKVLAFDFQRNRYWLCDSLQREHEAFDMPDGAPSGTMQLHLDKSNLLCTNVSGLARDPQEFFVDTGFNGALSMSPELFLELVEAGRIADVKETSAPLSFWRSGESGDGTSYKSGVLNEVILGEWTVTHVPVCTAPKNKIGLALLRKFNVLFDLREDHGIISLLPNIHFDKPFPDSPLERP